MLGGNQLSLNQIVDAIQAVEYIGFCVKCGYEAYGIEPDARGYECDECGESSIYGAEELLVQFGGIQDSISEDDFD